MLVVFVVVVVVVVLVVDADLLLNYIIFIPCIIESTVHTCIIIFTLNMFDFIQPYKYSFSKYVILYATIGLPKTTK